jgi:hypothetical protein
LGIVTRNIPAKVAALVLAFVVWFTVAQDLTSTFPDEKTAIEVVLDSGLMLVADAPTEGKVVFRGPTSQINLLRREARRRIRLAVTHGDLAGQPENALTFSVDRGNILHAYGEEVEIVSVDPSPIILRVGIEETRQVSVRRPEVVGLPDEWEAEVGLKVPDVRVKGPTTVFAELTEVKSEPVQAAALLEGREDELEFTSEGVLELAREYRDRYVRLVEGQRIEFSATFRRSREPREITLPFFVYDKEPNGPVIVEPSASGAVEKSTEGWTVRITFTGSRTALDALEEAAEKGEVRAYVRAEDCGQYANGKDAEEGTWGIDQQDLRVEDLPPGVSFRYPDDPFEVKVSLRKPQ